MHVICQLTALVPVSIGIGVSGMGEGEVREVTLAEKCMLRDTLEGTWARQRRMQDGA
jgi:hypothetical protein